MRDFLNNFFSNLLVQIIVTIVVAVIPYIVGIITNSIVGIGIVAFIILIVWSIALRYILTRPLKPSRFENTSSGKTRYSILIVDDEFGRKKTRASEAFAEYFTGWDMHQLKSINDARLTMAYDIIILDVLGANDFRGNTNDIFEEIYKNYPEKYVIAMSQNGGHCKELVDKKYADDYFTKQSNSGDLDVDNWKSETQKALNRAFELLDFPIEYWNHIEEKMASSSKKEIKLARKRYVSFLQSHTNFVRKQIIH